MRSTKSEGLVYTRQFELSSGCYLLKLVLCLQIKNLFCLRGRKTKASKHNQLNVTVAKSDVGLLQTLNKKVHWFINTQRQYD